MSGSVLETLDAAPAWRSGPDMAARSGLDRIASFATGVMPLPPAYLLVGMRPTACAEGRVEYRLDASGWTTDATGSVDRAALAYFADAPVSNAIHSVLPPDVTLRTVSLSLEYDETMRTDGGVVGEGLLHGDAQPTGLGTARLSADGGGTLATVTCRTLSIDYQPPGTGTDYPAPTTPVPARLGSPPGVPDEEVPGVERLEAMIGSPDRCPPFWRLMGCRPTEVERGRVAMAMVADPWLSSPAGLLYGGALAGLGVAALDAVSSSDDATGERTRLLGVRYEFTRMVLPDGSTVTAEAHLVQRGRTMVIADVEVRDGSGRRAGIGRATGVTRPR